MSDSSPTAFGAEIGATIINAGMRCMEPEIVSQSCTYQGCNCRHFSMSQSFDFVLYFTPEKSAKPTLITVSCRELRPASGGVSAEAASVQAP